MPRIGNVSLASRQRDVIKYGRLLRGLNSSQFGGGVLGDTKKRIMEFKLIGKMSKAVNGLQVALKDTAKKTGSVFSSFFNMFRSTPSKKDENQLGGGNEKELNELRDALSEHTSEKIKQLLKIDDKSRDAVNQLLRQDHFRGLFFMHVTDDIFQLPEKKEYYISWRNSVELAGSDEVKSIKKSFDELTGQYMAVPLNGNINGSPFSADELEKANNYIKIMAKLIFPRIFHNDESGKSISILVSPDDVEKAYEQIISYTNSTHAARPKFISKYIAFVQRTLDLLNSTNVKSVDELKEILAKEFEDLEKTKQESLFSKSFPSSNHESGYDSDDEQKEDSGEQRSEQSDRSQQPWAVVGMPEDWNKKKVNTSERQDEDQKEHSGENRSEQNYRSQQPWAVVGMPEDWNKKKVNESESQNEDHEEQKYEQRSEQNYKSQQPWTVAGMPDGWDKKNVNVSESQNKDLFDDGEEQKEGQFSQKQSRSQFDTSADQGEKKNSAFNMDSDEEAVAERRRAVREATERARAEEKAKEGAKERAKERANLEESAAKWKVDDEARKARERAAQYKADDEARKARDDAEEAAERLKDEREEAERLAKIKRAEAEREARYERERKEKEDERLRIERETSLYNETIAKQKAAREVTVADGNDLDDDSDNGGYDSDAEFAAMRLRAKKREERSAARKAQQYSDEAEETKSSLETEMAAADQIKAKTPEELREQRESEFNERLAELELEKQARAEKVKASFGFFGDSAEDTHDNIKSLKSKSQLGGRKARKLYLA
jgi:hypothetical protein